MTPMPTHSLRGQFTRQALAYLAFGITYYLLAVYAASLPLQSRGFVFIWPAHGVALATLLIAPTSRWPAYLVLVLLDTLIVATQSGAPAANVAIAAVVNVLEPAIVAAGLMKLAGPTVEIGTLRGLAAFLVGMVPLVAGTTVLEAFYYVQFEAGFRQRWSVTFFSTILAVLLTAPLILAWNRRGYLEAMETARERWPELLVLFTFLIVATAYVFGAAPDGAGFSPPAYVATPFLIWAALRFGLRAATLGLAVMGLIAYWYTGHGLGPFPIGDGSDVRQLLNLQGFLAVLIITTLFAAALVVERQEAIREIHEWRYRHERVIRASGSLLYDMDPATGTLVWDGDTPGVIGTTPERIATTRQWMLRVHPDDRHRLRGLREELLSGKLSHLAIEYRFRRDDDEYITIGVNAYRIFDPVISGGRRIIGFVKDVSEKVRADEERRRLEAQLKQAEKMQAVGHLAGGIAHDFNNILGSILGYGELAQDKARDPDIRRYLDTIMHAGNRAKSLVTQILSYSRAEGTQKMPVIVAPIAEETCELIRGSSRPTLEVRFRSEAAEGAAVMGDPTRLHQLLMNLCSNAVQAMSQSGVLEVVVATERIEAPRKVRTGELAPGDYVRVTVSDTGHGIAPEVIDRIFEPFFTTKPAGQGTGLGLALVHSVASEHHGLIDVASKLGGGTTFTVWLPQVHAVPGEDIARAPLPPGRGEVVLAVDDEPEVLAALEEMLASLGYEPAGFRDSREALEAFRAKPGNFDAVVSDEVMPGLTGTQLAIELRKINPALPILIASGFGGSGFETRALSAGVNRVLRKPYRMAEIGEVLAGFFAGKQ